MRRKSAWEFGLCLALCLGWAAVVWSAPEKDALTLRVDIDNDAVLRGIATVTAIADSESETELVAKVEFKVNDALRATDTSVPYVFRWDTLEGADGNYRLEVTATDTAGKSASRSFKVRVDNAEGKTAADHAILALQALEKKDYAGAALSARKALRLEPGQPQASGLYARALLAQGSLEKAASVLEDGLKIHPDSSDLSLLLASAHARRGLEAAKSLDDYRDALKTAQSQKRMALGRLIRKAGADEKDARAQAELGAIYLEQRDLAAAARALAEANELDPARDDIVLSLAMVCWYRGKMRDARYILQGAVRAGQDSAQVRAGLAALAVVQRQADVAIEQARKSIEEKGASPKLRQVLAHAFLLKGQPREAAKPAMSAVEALPDDWTALYLAGAAASDSGDWGKAIEHASKAITINPLWPEPYVLRGYTHLLMGLNEPAAADFELALETAPGDHSALCGMALTQSLLKQPGEAESFIRKALAAAPENPSIHLAAAFVYSRASNSEAQRRSLEKARSLDYVNFAYMTVPNAGRVVSICHRYQRNVVLWTNSLKSP